ncbi:MAG TPA: heme-binding protein [Gammaproteobacteria bacterium]|jgi:uncharacterized protein GlcG (DUF336 family)
MSKLTLEQANAIIAKAFEARRAGNGKPLAVAVLDDSGILRSVQREDGASMFRPDVAFGKGWAAVAMDAPSRELAKRAQKNPTFFASLAAVSGGRMAINPGGVLIRDAGGHILGAVGISGDTGERDEEFAIAGIVGAGLVADAGQ